MSEIDKLSGNAKRLASHLLKKSSNEELQQFLKTRRPDQIELDSWGITAAEWKSAIDAVVTDRAYRKKN